MVGQKAAGIGQTGSACHLAQRLQRLAVKAGDAVGFVFGIKGARAQRVLRGDAHGAMVCVAGLRLNTPDGEHETARRIAPVRAQRQRPRDAEFVGDDSQVWVSSEIGGTVSIIDSTSHEIVHTLRFDLPGVSSDRIQPVGMELTSDGKLAFVALGPANHVAVVDRESLEVIKYLLVGRRVWHLALTPEEDKLYTTNGVSGDVTVIDVDSLRAEKTIKVGRYPWGVTILPREHVPGDA